MDYKNIERHGALPDIPDKRDYILKDMVLGVPYIPKTFRLSKSSTKEQGKRGTCVAFSGCAILEYFNRVDDLSEEYLFKRIKENDIKDYNYSGYGAYLRSAAKAMTNNGACLEASCPYINGAEDTWKNEVLSDEQDLEAYIYHTKSYAAVEGTEMALKQALCTTNAPLLIGITLYKNYRESQSTGVLPVPEGDVVGGHALSLIGWDETHFIAKNSWGEWGDGILLIPFGYKIFTSWSFVDWSSSVTTKMRLILALRYSSKFIRYYLRRLKKRIS